MTLTAELHAKKKPSDRNWYAYDVLFERLGIAGSGSGSTAR